MAQIVKVSPNPTHHPPLICILHLFQFFVSLYKRVSVVHDYFAWWPGAWEAGSSKDFSLVSESPPSPCPLMLLAPERVALDLGVGFMDRIHCNEQVDDDYLRYDIR